MKKTTYVFSIKRLYPAFFIMFCLMSVPCFSQTLSGASVEFVELGQTKTVNGSDQSLDATPAQATYDVEFKVAGENYYVDVDDDKIIIGARNGSVISAVTSITFNFSGGTFSSIIGASFNPGASTGTNTSGVSASFTATSVTISGIQNKDFAQGYGLGNMGTVVFDITTAGVANTAPVIGGATAGQSVNDNGIISPFSSIITTDADGDNLSATITLDDNAKGILTGTGLSGTGPYTIVSTTPADLQTKLRALSFNPTDNRTSTTETTTFTIVVNDGTDTDTDNTTSVISSAVAPSVSSVNVPANATYITGQNLDFTVNFNENITVSTTGGVPQIAITIGATTHQATYINGSGTSALLFRHTVFTGELDTDGIAVGSLAANGSALKDSGGKDANLTLNSVGSTAAVLVDAVPPSGYTVQIDQANVNASNETAISFTLFGAEVGTVYNYTIRNNIGGTSISGSGNIGTSNQQITNIDVSSLDDGNLTVSVFLTDSVGNIGNNATDTTTKNTATYTPNANNILFINKNVSGGNGSGDSWANAIPELSDALKWARTKNEADNNWLQNDSLQVFVAKGTYLPLYNAADGQYTNNGNRDNAFVMVKNVQLYGGFDPANNITDLTHTRDFSETTGSILSGDINGNNTNKAYHVVISINDVGNALLNGFTLTDGNADEVSTITVNGQAISRGHGGGMYNFNSSPSLTHVTIANNTTNHNGGGMYNINYSSPSLTNVSIANNTANSGGGMYNYYSSPSLTNVSIANNTAVNWGGGICNFNNSSPSLTSVIISNNTANDGGGGIYNQASFPTLTKVNIKENTAYNGGGMYNNASSPNLTNVSIANNTAIYGGGVYNIDSLSPSLTNVTIANNTAGLDGGGMYNTNSSPSLTNVSIVNNTAVDWGGGICNLTNSSPSLTNVTIANNTVVNFGGGMYNHSSSSPIINNSIVWGRIDNSFGSNYTAKHSLIEGNSNTSNGNLDTTGLSETDIFTDPANGDYSLKDGSPAINTGSNSLYTGDINNDTDLASNPRLYDNTTDIGAFENQTATIILTPSANNILYVNKNVTGGNGSGDSWANAIPKLADALKWARTENEADNYWLQNDSLQIFVAKGTYFPLYNAADEQYTNNGNRDNAFVMVKNVQLYGGFDPANNITDLTHTRDFSETTGSILSGDINSNNTNKAYHVVISASDVGNALLNGFSITGGNADGFNNITVNGQDIWLHNGGGMFNQDSSPSLTSVTIVNNTADNNGGGMYNFNSSPNLINVSVVNNTANDGGGMFNQDSSPSLTNVTIANNTATNNGSGMYNFSSSPSLTNVTIVNNTATAYGGGMYNYSSSPSLINASIANNTANYGGGMYNNFSSSNLTNVTIVNNTSNNNGEGMYNLDNSSTTINNSIIWGEIIDDNSSHTAKHSLIQGNNNTNNGNIDATGLNETDIFTDPANGDYSLKDGSPAINTGSNSLYTGDLNNDTDLTGNPRLYNNTIDIGAFESQNVPPTAICKNITVQLDANGQISITASDVDDGSSDLEGNVTLSIDKTDFDCSNIGDNTVILTVEDSSGATATCQAIVTVKDVTAPTPDNLTLADITAECQVLATEVPVPTATDNCGETIYGTHNLTFPISTQGTHVITWTFDDGNGNTDTQTQNIIINDVTAPTPDNLTLADITAECQVLATDVPIPTATDNCGEIIYGTHNLTFPISTQGTHVITWTFDDGKGNADTQTQNIIIDDVTTPTPDNLTLADITAECQVLATEVPVPTATDNCGETIYGTHNLTFPISTQGTHVITWTFDDGNGNTDTQTQNIIINDVTAPTPDNLTLADITAECQVLATDVPIPTATDNCGKIIYGTHNLTFPISTQGTHVITWTFDDGKGNADTQTQNIIINDVTAPIPDLTNLPVIERQCAVFATDIPIPTATDNCEGSINATTTDPLTYSDQGTHTITWTFNDGNGNTSTQTQSIIVHPSPIENLSLNDLTVTYDGNLHQINVNNLPTGASVSYSTTPNTGEANGAINAGVYTVTAIVSPPANAINCEDISLTATLTIEKAPQEITFNSLPILYIEDDDDFQLTATASSGLPVDYTYTFTANNPPATVSSTGWVTLLTSGMIEITVHQAGNENYLPATPVMQPLQINSRDASIHHIAIDNEVYHNPSEEIYYTIDCETEQTIVTIELTTETNATALPAHYFEIETPVPGIYKKQVQITSQDGSSVRNYTIIIEKRFSFEDIVIQKFNNVLLVNNNPSTNGGYRFIAYKWYKNNQLISNTQYYSTGNEVTDTLDPNAVYHVEVTTENGEVISSCEFQITLNNTDYSIDIYPNPVKNTPFVTIHNSFPLDDVEDGMDIQLYSLTGQKVRAYKVYTQKTRINVSDLSSGVYIIECKTKSYKKVSKVIID